MDVGYTAVVPPSRAKANQPANFQVELGPFKSWVIFGLLAALPCIIGIVSSQVPTWLRVCLLLIGIGFWVLLWYNHRKPDN